jgi:signal transduction histidine kinase
MITPGMNQGPTEGRPAQREAVALASDVEAPPLPAVSQGRGTPIGLAGPPVPVIRPRAPLLPSSRKRGSASRLRQAPTTLYRRIAADTKQAGVGPQVLVAALLLAVALSAFFPQTRLEQQAVAARVTFETAATLICGLAAVLFLHRFWQHLRARDLLLGGGLTVIATADLLASTVLTGDLAMARQATAWLVLGGRLLGWTLITAAALVAHRRLRRPAHARRRASLGAATVVAVVAAPVIGLSAHASSHLRPPAVSVGHHGAALAVYILVALLAGAAAGAFARDAGGDPRPHTRWLALACTLVAAGALAGCASPAVLAPRVGVSEILLLGGIASLFAAVCVEWSVDERHAPNAALAHERRRMAAEVHDLIMQDLSFALANARTLVDDPVRAPYASTVVSAGERALAGAREVVSTLTTENLQPIAPVLEATARAAAREIPLRFNERGAAGAVAPDEPTREALLHIAREAVTNAVKHAGASLIDVSLVCAEEWWLYVHDNGRGFDSGARGQDSNPASERVGGFGLTSMRRHAEALGGGLSVRSNGHGTTVEASLP